MIKDVKTLQVKEATGENVYIYFLSKYMTVCTWADYKDALLH